MRFKEWLPNETVDAIPRFFAWRIKGPLTTPVGGGIRSLKRGIAADFGFCIRAKTAGAVFHRCSLPRQAPGKKMDLVIFRENTRGRIYRDRVEVGQPGSQKAIGIFKTMTC